MNSVERVKTICKERKIPISKLERDLGYANGYISQLRKGVFPANRLSEIAKYLSVSPEFLMTGTEDKKKPLVNDDEELTEYLDELRNRSEMRMLFSVTKTATKDQIEAIVKMVESMQGDGGK